MVQCNNCSTEPPIKKYLSWCISYKPETQVLKHKNPRQEQLFSKDKLKAQMLCLTCIL